MWPFRKRQPRPDRSAPSQYINPSGEASGARQVNSPRPGDLEKASLRTVSPRGKAHLGRDLICEAITELITASDTALTHAAIVDSLGIASDFEGGGRNYLSWSALGLLVNSGQVRYRGDRLDRVYYVCEAQLDRRT